MVFPGPQGGSQGSFGLFPWSQDVQELGFESRGYCLQAFGPMAPLISETPRTLPPSSCDIASKGPGPQTFEQLPEKEGSNFNDPPAGVHAISLARVIPSRMSS